MAGYTFTPASITCENVTNDLTGQQNFTALLNTYTISGQVTHNGNPLIGVTISYAGDSTLTDGSGEYSISVEENATLTLTPSLTGYTFTPASITCSNVTANLTGKDFTATSTVGTLEIGRGDASVKVYPNPTTGQLQMTNYELKK